METKALEAFYRKAELLSQKFCIDGTGIAERPADVESVLHELSHILAQNEKLSELVEDEPLSIISANVKSSGNYRRVCTEKQSDVFEIETTAITRLALEALGFTRETSAELTPGWVMRENLMMHTWHDVDAVIEQRCNDFRNIEKAFELVEFFLQSH
jgi:hypothetical protein